MGAEPLEAFFARTSRLAVAFSGGCDSAYLLAAAQQAGCEVGAYLMATAFQPAFELEDAQRLAKELGVGLRVVRADVIAEPGFRALAEQGVVSPLRRAAMTKAAVRAASRKLCLFTADKPRFSCLAVHVPAGAPITAASLDEAARSCGIL